MLLKKLIVGGDYMYDMTFINACLFGDTDLDELDDYVEYWHTHETGSSLREFLGMSEYEYEEWLKNDDTILRDILRCRVDKISFEEYKHMSDDERVAARSYSIDDIEKLKNNNKHGRE